MTLNRVIAHLGVTADVALQVLGVIRGNVCPRDIPGVREWEASLYTPARPDDLKLQALDILLGGYGVEALGRPIDRRCTPQAEYINVGETYAPTVVRDHERQRWTLTTWGDFAEQRGLA